MIVEYKGSTAFQEAFAASKRGYARDMERAFLFGGAHTAGERKRIEIGVMATMPEWNPEYQLQDDPAA